MGGRTCSSAFSAWAKDRLWLVTGVATSRHGLTPSAVVPAPSLPLRVQQRGRQAGVREGLGDHGRLLQQHVSAGASGAGGGGRPVPLDADVTRAPAAFLSS